MLPGRNRRAQTAQQVPASLFDDDSVRGGCGVEDGHAGLDGMRGELDGSGLFDQERGRPEVERKHHERTETEGEGQWGGTGADVICSDLDDVAAEGVGVDEDVAVEVHRHLRHARGPRGRAEESHVVCRGLDVVECLRLPAGGGDEICLIGAAACDQSDSVCFGRSDDVVEEPVVGDGDLRRCQRDELLDFDFAQQRHRRDDHGTGLE